MLYGIWFADNLFKYEKGLDICYTLLLRNCRAGKLGLRSCITRCLFLAVLVFRHVRHAGTVVVGRQRCRRNTSSVTVVPSCPPARGSGSTPSSPRTRPSGTRTSRHSRPSWTATMWTGPRSTSSPTGTVAKPSSTCGSPGRRSGATAEEVRNTIMALIVTLE